MVVGCGDSRHFHQHLLHSSLLGHAQPWLWPIKGWVLWPQSPKCTSEKFQLQPLWEMKGLWKRNVKNTHKTRGTIQVQSLETATVKGPLDPFQSQGDSSFFLFLPRLSPCLTGEVRGLCLHGDCYSFFLGTAAFDRIWKALLKFRKSRFLFLFFHELSVVGYLILGWSLSSPSYKMRIWEEVVCEVPSNSDILLFYQIHLGKKVNPYCVEKKHGPRIWQQGGKLFFIHRTGHFICKRHLHTGNLGRLIVLI